MMPIREPTLINYSLKPVVFPNGIIELEETWSHEILNRLVEHTSKVVMDTKEAATRAALIKLGWTPPSPTTDQRYAAEPIQGWEVRCSSLLCGNVQLVRLGAQRWRCDVCNREHAVIPPVKADTPAERDPASVHTMPPAHR